MFDLSQKYSVGRPILNCEYIRCTPPSLNLEYGENNQIFLAYLENVVLFTWKIVILNYILM